MRRLRYSVAVSMDGFIAGPRDEYDWIIMDPSFDFEGLFKQFDTLLMGRRTFEFTRKVGGATMGERVRLFARRHCGRVIIRRSRLPIMLPIPSVRLRRRRERIFGFLAVEVFFEVCLMQSSSIQLKLLSCP